MENKNIRQSWEWETYFEQSFWLDIGEKGLQSLVDNKNDKTAREPKCFATLSNEEMDRILEEKHSVKTKQTGQRQHLKVGLSHRIFKIHADGSNNK